MRLALLGERERLAGAAAHHAARYRGAIEPLTPDAIDGAGVIIDAIFGAGLSRPLDGVARATVEAVAAHRSRSQRRCAERGRWRDRRILGTAAPADITVTFFRKKPGHLLYPGRELCGTV